MSLRASQPKEHTGRSFKVCYINGSPARKKNSPSSSTEINGDLSDNLKTMPEIILGSQELTYFTALIKVYTLFTNIGHLKWERVCADVLKQRKHPGICFKKVGLREEVQGRGGLVVQVEQ